MNYATAAIIITLVTVKAEKNCHEVDSPQFPAVDHLQVHLPPTLLLAVCYYGVDAHCLIWQLES